MRRIFITLIFALISTNLFACESWSDGSNYSNAVFSDDGQGVAAVLLTYDKKDKITHTTKKNFTTQVLMKDTTSSVKPAVLSDPMPGRTIDLFYMRSEGYIILGRESDQVVLPDGSRESEIYYDYIATDGTVTSLGGGTFLTSLSCDGGTSYGPVSPPLRVIPSPDGSVLARFEAQTTCDSRTQSLTLLDAQDLSIIGGPYIIPDVPKVSIGATSAWAMLDIGWTSSNKFATAYWGSGSTFASLKGTLFKAGQAPQKNVTMGTKCFYPPTTSSEIRADGAAVSIDETSGSIVLSSGGEMQGSQGAFGCN